MSVHRSQLRYRIDWPRLQHMLAHTQMVLVVGLVEVIACLPE